jgi:hypothetical protein
MLRAAAVVHPLPYGLSRVLPASAAVIALAVTVSLHAGIATKILLLTASAAAWLLLRPPRRVLSRG